MSTLPIAASGSTTSRVHEAAVVRHIAPAEYVAGRGAIAEFGRVVRFHGKQLLLVHGGRGWELHEDALARSLRGSEVELAQVLHRGPCTESSIADTSTAAREARAEVVAGVGGGKVIDVAKGAAAALGLPFVAVPTSPATCAAVTPLVVLYDEGGRWLRGLPLSRCPDAVLVDHDVLASVPDRLLSAGVADALAKCHEVRLAFRRAAGAPATGTSSLALCQHLEDLLFAHASHALRNAPGDTDTYARRTVAEAAIFLPGIIAGLAGETVKLAAAHAIHNALTLLPGCRESLHGELVGFGIIVQCILDEQDPAHVVDLFQRIGLPLGLQALGCDGYRVRESEVCAAVLLAPAFHRAFPAVDSRALSAAMDAADAVALSAGQGPGGTRGSL